VYSSALTRGFPTGSSKRDTSILSNSYISSSSRSSRGLARLSLLRTQLRIELLALLNRVRLLSTKVFIVVYRIIALTIDFVVGVYKRRYSKIV
jgi:hypothetical protein